MATPTTPSALHALFLFNPTLGEEATEARKLLFFCDQRPESVHQRAQPGHSHYVDLNFQKDLCGIAEGLIAFTRDFAPETLCESVHCQNHRYAFLQAEADYWLVLVVTNPTRLTKDPATKALVTEYLEDELEDSVLQAIIHRCYSLFTLFNSSFQAIVAESSHDALREKLRLFMSYYLPTIRFSQLIYFTDIHGFQFLPVEKTPFLTIQYIINLLTLNFAGGAATAGASGHPLVGPGCVIRNCALMYNSKLIYSGLNSEIMFLLYSLDQDPMYWFLTDYLSLKETLHLDIGRYMEAVRREPVVPPTYPWTLTPPPHFPGIYNVPESPYERNGRVATNKKAWDKAMNKGEVPDDVNLEQEDEDLPPANGRLGDDDGVLLERDGSSGSRSNSNVGLGPNNALPFGYMTGPFRASMSGPLSNPMPAGSPAHALGLGPGASAPPCINSPLIYLDGFGGIAQGSAKGSRFGSGNPSVEGNLPNYHEFPGSQLADGTEAAPTRPLRLVVYQKYKITLFLVVEEEETTKKTDDAGGASGQTVASSSISPQPQPPTQFYSALESFMDSNLKKLGEMLHDQTVRLGLNGGSGGGPEEPFRFLYFNHMNLALKTSLSSAAPTPAKGAAAGGSVLTMETIKIIRELHQDFNTPGFRSQAVARGAHDAATTAGPQRRPAHLQHHIREEGCTEVCVKTRSSGWVVGRRATQSHREFFLLLEDSKVVTLAEIQEEVEALSKTYFYNIFIH